MFRKYLLIFAYFQPHVFIDMFLFKRHILFSLHSFADVGMQYQTESSIQHMKGGKAQNQQQQNRSRPPRRGPLDRPAFRGTTPVGEATSQGQISWRNSTDFDRLIITDLTVNEPDLDTAGRNLLR